MIASIARTVAPRGARFITTAARQPVATATAATSQQSASITTTASSIGNPGPAAVQQRHVVSQTGSLKSAHRHFHANSSESIAGLNESEIASARQASRMHRMREAKELAGL